MPRSGELALEALVEELAADCGRARQEEDVRVAMSTLLARIAERFRLELRGAHERSMLSGGRADSIYRHVTLEYKRPGAFRRRTGVQEAIFGRKDSPGGLATYLLEQAIEQSGSLESFGARLTGLVGVGFDGETFVFVRYVPGPQALRHRTRGATPAWLPAEIPFEPTFYKVDALEVGVRRLILFLRATRRQPLTAETLMASFGGRSAHARRFVPELYDLFGARLEARQREVGVRYGEWERIFGIVYGETPQARPEVLADIRRTYPWAPDALDLKRFVFTLHTYYNAVLKLVVASLVSSTRNPFHLIRERVLDLDDARFDAYCVQLLDGTFFANAGLSKLFHESYFEWIRHAWTPEVRALFRAAFEILDDLEPSIAVVGPEYVRDVVKDTYEAIVPRKLRHLMGEYFTPDWLAEHTLESVGYTGAPGVAMLDPTCGSGTFLVQAIKRKRARIGDDTAFARDVLATVVGFDINPISVISAKVNVLLALGDTLDGLPEVRIPVYLCDSVLTPTVHARQLANSGEVRVSTVVGTFVVPARDREGVERVFDEIELDVVAGTTPAEFQRRLERRGEPSAATWASLYEQVSRLHAERRDGIWCDLLRNQFAPLFVEHAFDFVVGNPPWVSWRNMSAEYRATTLDIWLSYGIFEKSAYDKRTTHDDFAMAVTYVTADHFLEHGGKLGFVLSQAFFKSKKGGEGFRKLVITREGEETALGVDGVDDMAALKPFPGVANRTAVLVLTKGRQTAYPVPYRVWSKRARGALAGDLSLAEVRRRTEVTELVATPIDADDARSPWLTVPAPMLQSIRSLLGRSPYRGRKGVEPLGAKGVYFLQRPTKAAHGRVRITNDLSRGRYPDILAKGEHSGTIEPDLVYPMLSGRNIARWRVLDTAWVVFPHQEARGPHNAIPVSQMRTSYPRTYAWLRHWEPELLATRARNGKFYDARLDPFYCLDNVGLYTWSPHKVAWCEQGSSFTACVIDEIDDDVLGRKMVLVDSKVLYCSLDDEDEAYFLAAMLNSSPVRFVIDAYTIDTQRGIDVLDMIEIPRFDTADGTHERLQEASRSAHRAAAAGEAVAGIEAEIDALAARILGLPGRG